MARLSASNGLRKNYMTKGLAGWQRLGIVLAIGWAGVIVGMYGWPSDLSDMQALDWVEVAVWWLSPLSAVATVAYASRWVYRGFRPSEGDERATPNTPTATLRPVLVMKARGPKHAT